MTDYINEGIILKYDCTLGTDKSVLYGNVTFNNYTQMGQRYLQTKSPLLSVETLNNLTFNYVTIRSFTRPNDANMYSVSLSAASCTLVKAGLFYNYLLLLDGNKKYFNFTNVYISSDSQEVDTSTCLTVGIMQSSDANLRTFVPTFENVTQ